MLFRSAIPKIAKTSIKVWKLLIKTDNGFKTPYQDFVVNIGDTIKAKEPNVFIESAPYINTVFCIDKQGVHAYKTQRKAKRSKLPNEIITEWQIPAGAKYWVGSEYSKGEIAATEMKFIKECHTEYVDKVQDIIQTERIPVVIFNNSFEIITEEEFPKIAQENVVKCLDARFKNE